MKQKKTISISLLVLFPVTLLLINCASRQPIHPQEVLRLPDIDYSIYKRLTVLEFAPNPQVRKNKKISDIFEDELQKKGFDVVRMDEFNSVLEALELSRENLTDTEVLKKVGKKLEISSVIKGTVEEYEVKKKKGFILIPINGSTMLIDTTKYYCDISFTIEMIELQEGNKIWACSMSYNDKYKSPMKLMRKMIRECLSTFPIQSKGNQ